MSGAQLSLSHVSFAPPGGPTLLKPVSFDLNPGEVLGVVGANGAGKSTLLRLIYRYHRPVTGSVKIDNEDLWRLNARAAAQKIAAVLQEQPTDFALSVREIAALGRRPHNNGFSGQGARDEDVITSALARMQLAPLADRRLGTLSGGERQRVMVARALAQEPKLLVLDEPTNHLDIRHQLEILDLIRDLRITIVTSLHDLNMAANLCDRILLLADGAPLAFGAPSEVLTIPNVETAFGVRTRIDRLASDEQAHFVFHL